MLVLLAWLLTAGTSLAIYKRFPWLFDHFPGWAVLAGGFWVILVVVTLGLSAAAVKHSAIEGASRSRPPYLTNAAGVRRSGVRCRHGDGMGLN